MRLAAATRKERFLEMQKEELLKDLKELFASCTGNTVPADKALEHCEGLVIFEEPVFGVSRADDPIYRTFKEKEVIGDNFLLPAEWLAEARSVISFFLPFTETVKRSNRGEPEKTSPEWLHGRVRLLQPLRSLHPPLPGRRHQPGGRQKPDPLQSVDGSHEKTLRPALRLRQVPDRCLLRERDPGEEMKERQ